MSRSIWLIMYDLASQDEARYLDWFHDIHIPEKLARPGYNWAAHYELLSVDGERCLVNGSSATGGSRGFAAFFGGTDTRTFLSPSSAQIKPNQPPLTREMMAYRIGSESLIAAEEWRVENPNIAEPGYQVLEIVTCDTGGHDEDYGAWSIQMLCPHLLSLSGFEVLAKMLSTTSAAKHVTVASFRSLTDVEAHRRQAPSDAWSMRVRDYQVNGHRLPMLGRCIWPQIRGHQRKQ